MNLVKNRSFVICPMLNVPTQIFLSPHLKKWSFNKNINVYGLR